jgi:hypothetical protein
MPDTLVGATIRSQDFPPAVWTSETTAQTDITSTSFVAGTPTASITFLAPTSGEVLIFVGAGMRDSAGNRVHLAPEVRENNVSGAVVLSADVTTRGVGSNSVSTGYQYHSRITLLTGLTPGGTYFARTMQKVSGGTTCDLAIRDIGVIPTPLGGNFAGKLIKALDYPPATWAQDTTSITNPTTSSYIAGTPAVEVTFNGPTSGRVLLIVGAGIGNSAGSNRIFLAPEVRETDSSGALVLSATVTERGYSSHTTAAAFHYGSRASILEGLTPGQLYYARAMYVVATGDGGTNTADISCREIVVASLP